MKMTLWYRKKYKLSTKEVLVRSLCVYLFVAFWGILGFSGVIGYVYAWELYIIIPLYGGFLAVYESASRTMFCELVSPGQEAEFFGIYEISDKGSSWIGPMVVAILYDRFGSVRYAFIYLFIACIVSIVVLKKFVDPEMGAMDCRNKKNLVGGEGHEGGLPGARRH